MTPRQQLTVLCSARDRPNLRDPPCCQRGGNSQQQKQPNRPDHGIQKSSRDCCCQQRSQRYIRSERMRPRLFVADVVASEIRVRVVCPPIPLSSGFVHCTTAMLAENRGLPAIPALISQLHSHVRYPIRTTAAFGLLSQKTEVRQRLEREGNHFPDRYFDARLISSLV